MFVVQKHHATRLHWDFRLEHGGVLWSWAVPRGPSLDPKDKRLAVHVEDHPLDYAGFEGVIPAGEYGAGTVEIWDRGNWAPVGADPQADLARGEMKFALSGERLRGRFVLIRLKPRPNERAENWLLIKEHDEHEQAGTDVAAMEQTPLSKPKATAKAKGVSKAAGVSKAGGSKATGAPARGAKRGALPDTQAPQLASSAEEPPETGEWLSEIKYDGYRLLALKEGDTVRLLTRNGLDWTARLHGVARAIQRLQPRTLLLDGELVALRPDGTSSFGDLQAALSEGRGGLTYFVFDLLHLDGWDLRPCRLDARKTALGQLQIWNEEIRFSDHVPGDTAPVRRQACSMGLEGIIVKRADAPYRAGRSGDWLKLKCQGREEFIVLGWTPPAKSRSGIGSLHLGFYDATGALHYVGGVGTGFSQAELLSLRNRLDSLTAPAPPGLLLAGEAPPAALTWVRPELVAEVQFAGWSGAGRIRHGVYLGLRDDKAAAEVVRDVPDPEVARTSLRPRRSGMIVTAPAKRGSPDRAPKRLPRPAPPDSGSAVRLTHPDRELWPGITKQDLADYWAAVAQVALPGIARRPLALVRCPDGVDGQHFFQKHAMKGMQQQFREGEQDGAPYLAFDDAEGLQAAAQMAAIELHSWGSTAADPAHADRLVFDLDPGPEVDWASVIETAKDVRDRLGRLGLTSFCRTSGGKGLHVVAALQPGPDWTTVRAWCRRFAETMEAEAPNRYVASVPKSRRTGRILIDWLRNGLGSTAVASFSPRARAFAPVATPVTWREVTSKLDPTAFTLSTGAQAVGPFESGSMGRLRRGRSTASVTRLRRAPR